LSHQILGKLAESSNVRFALKLFIGFARFSDDCAMKRIANLPSRRNLLEIFINTTNVFDLQRFFAIRFEKRSNEMFKREKNSDKSLHERESSSVIMDETSMKVFTWLIKSACFE
jgi:hypothetical protein